MRSPLLEIRDDGLYCPGGDFYIDPWNPVERAVITHAHADHAVAGSRDYLCSSTCAPLLQARLGSDIAVQPLAYGVSINIGSVSVTLHPAGHILGSAQVEVASGGYSWVVSGDYKLRPDSTSEAFEPVRCHGFVTEATFALPIFRWPAAAETFAEINAWWQRNRDDKRASVLYGYSLGKAQRLIAGVDASIGPIYTHGSVQILNDIYRRSGIPLPSTIYAMEAGTKDFRGALVVAPPAMNGSAWVRRFGNFSNAMASGWMAIRGHRRRRAIDRGFVLSDHADWPQLLSAIKQTGAEQVWVTHGLVEPLARWLNEAGIAATGVKTHFADEDENPREPEPSGLEPTGLEPAGAP